jgi:hypothetical protein
MLHILEPRHSDRFFELLAQHYPGWCNARAELNALPLSGEPWGPRLGRSRPQDALHQLKWRLRF